METVGKKGCSSLLKRSAQSSTKLNCARGGLSRKICRSCLYRNSMREPSTQAFVQEQTHYSSTSPETDSTVWFKQEKCSKCRVATFRKIKSARTSVQQVPDYYRKVTLCKDRRGPSFAQNRQSRLLFVSETARKVLTIALGQAPAIPESDSS